MEKTKESILVTILLKNIIAQGSPYYFGQEMTWDDIQEEKPLLKESFKGSGILNPIIVLPSKNNGQSLFHLIDGYKRFAYASYLNAESIQCIICPSESAKDIGLFLLQQHEFLLKSKPVSKARFITMLMNFDIPMEFLTHTVFPFLSLPRDAKIVKQCKQLLQLPLNVQNYLNQKQFAIKHCFHLLRYPQNILEMLVNLNNHCPMSASIYLELCEQIHDIIRFKEITLVQLLQKPSISNLLSHSCDSNSQLKSFREAIHSLRFPTLSMKNDQILHHSKSASLPSNMTLHWDAKLENKELNLNMTWRTEEEWNQLKQYISDKQLDICTKEILNIL